MLTHFSLAAWFRRLDGSAEAAQPPDITSRLPRANSAYRETLIFVVVFGLLTYLLSRPAFDGFFYGEDFLRMGAYFFHHGNFLKAIATPIAPMFYRPAAVAWLQASQLLLPWDPLLHHVRNFVFTLVDLFLLHRIMLRVSASRDRGGIGMAFFAVSKVHLVNIGIMFELQTIVTLMHFLLCLLFLLRYLQERRWPDYALAVGFFVLTAFSRDYSVVLLVVIAVLFAFAADRDASRRLPRRQAALITVPFLLVACVYLLARYSVVGLPPVGSDKAYGMQVSWTRLSTHGLAFAGNLMNLSMAGPPSVSGVGDLATLVTSDPVIQRAYALLCLEAGCALLVWTAASGIRKRKWTSFALIWALIIIGPTFLVQAIQVYYATESVAAVALVLAMCLDYGVGKRTILLGGWTVALAFIAANGYATNQNASILWWRTAESVAGAVNQQVFAPDRGEPVRSLTIVTPTPDLAAEVIRWINPLDRFDQTPMPRVLMNPQLQSFRVVTPEEYSGAEWTGLGDADLVYYFHAKNAWTPAEFAFTRVPPVERGKCNSFEGDLGNFDSGWVVNTGTTYQPNSDAGYVSDGRGSIEVSVASKGSANVHYGGIRLPLPPSREFELDFWIDKPESVDYVFAYEMDDQGFPARAWVNSDPGGTLMPRAMNSLTFQLNTGNLHGFEWNPENRDSTSTGLDFFVQVKEGQQVRFYIDRLCELLPVP